MRLDNEGVCYQCFLRDQHKRINEPRLMSVENDMDPGDIPNELPTLSMVEEMLVTRIHVHTQVFQVRGVQWKYKGHVYNFFRDTGRIFNKLPLLPQYLEVVLVRPPDSGNNTRLRRQFRRESVVRR